ncbi:MAG: prolyl oligopeptidase family serine peptidase [Prevotellaceae bacterium]|jgi:prolyl oligopeptidase|nr:prolyl oligopeptidase family serine peptidase [Prevotellaceae bacterium]
MKKTTLFLSIMIILSSCGQKNAKIAYPETAKVDTVRVYFGDTVAEPYAWLENDTTAETEAWVNAENEITQNYLSKIPFRNKLKTQLTDLANYEKIGTPFVKNGKYYFFKNDGLQNQSVLYVIDNIGGVGAGRALPLQNATVLLDPNKLSEDGTVALKSVDFSNDGKYMSYSISRSGSDWEEIYVMDLATKTLLYDKIEWAKFSSLSWCKDGFYYSAYAAPTKGKEFSNVNENHKIFYHKIGTEQKEDWLFYENKKYPKRFYHAFVPEEEKAIFIDESGSNNGNRLFVFDFYGGVTKTSSYLDIELLTLQPIEIASDDQFEYNVVEMIGDKFYVLTNYKAPKYRLMAGTLDKPNIKNWVDVIPEGENVLISVDFTPENIIATYDQDAANHAFVYDLNVRAGRALPLRYEISLATFGTVGFSTSRKTSEIFYAFTSFTFPNTIFKFDINSNKSENYIQPKVKINADEYVTEQKFYVSKDGTKVPMFLVHKKGIKLDGNNPTLLYGYGGFNITYRPTFSPYRIPFLENGGVYVIANIRGGGEYGEEWHIAGTKMQKQNVFDDFIAAAEYLISEKYTSKEKLAILGGSNGGLLVGAVVNQRPDLFKAAIPEVGVMDMLRYHLFTIGWNWASDYGTSADSREMYEYLRAYSPMHNIKSDGTPYPAILVTTADHDDRVVPAHSFKYAATLQAANTGDAPKLIRIDTKAGHGSGKPISKTIDENADVYSFIMWNLGMKVK